MELVSAGGTSALGLSRNVLCACGSGRRYKHCCGALPAKPATSATERAADIDARRVADAKNRALAAHRAHDLSTAIAGYSEAVAVAKDDFDALHMRAVALYQMGCAEEALAAFFDLLRRGHVLNAAAWHNFGLAVAAAVPWADDPQLISLQARYRTLVPLPPKASDCDAKVSVVIASYNHAKFVSEAIASVARQSRLPDELVIIDDGSTDGSVEIIQRAIADFPCRVVFRSRENRGAATTFNEAIEAATGELIFPLNSDDYFAHDRIDTVVAHLRERQFDWGYGGLIYILANGESATDAQNTRAVTLRAVENSVHMAPTTGLAFLCANPAISTGNLFFRRSLWQRVGGFFDWRYHHDWHFALQASKFAEPVRIPGARYAYRIHESNTISEQNDRVQRECSTMMARALAELASFVPHDDENAFAPCAHVWRRAFFGAVGGVGFMEQLPREALLAFADSMTSPAHATRLMDRR